MKIKWITTLCAVALTTFATSATVAADKFPAKPIQVIIPFQPGDTDNMLRPYLERMHEFLGQQVMLIYKPGAGGAIGAGSVANSAPDGYTLVGTSPGSIVVVPLANKDVKYSTDDFEPIAAFTEGGFMLVVSSSSGWNSIDELVKHSKDKPDEVTFTSSGAMGITHLLAEAFTNEAGVKWRHIPYKGSAPAITALLGGHVDMASSAIAPAQAHIQAGTLKPLAVFGETRLKAYPDVPTLKELGYNMGSPAYYGILAPAGTPPEVINTIYEAAKKVDEKYGEEIAKNLAVMGAQVKLLNPQEYKEYLAGQKALFGDAVKSLNQ